VNGTAEQKTNITKLRIGPMQENSLPGEKCVRNQPLIDKDVSVFEYLKETLQKLSYVKLKEGIFIGPQIHATMNDDLF
jgi:hypothetical protein